MTGQNLYYNCAGQPTYFTAGVGVVYRRAPEHAQHFFLGHADDIKSLAVCPAAVQVGNIDFPARAIFATGQVTSHDSGPCICVWDSRVGSQQGSPELARLPFDKDARGILALGFSPDGTKLVAVASDNGHTVYIYDWRRTRVLCSGRGCMGDPPQVYGVEWCPYEVTHPGQVPSQFVTFGKKHMKLWSCANGVYTGKQVRPVLVTGRRGGGGGGGGGGGFHLASSADRSLSTHPPFLPPPPSSAPLASCRCKT